MTMIQNNLYYEKGGKKSPKHRAKNWDFSTVYFRTKIWPYLGRGAKNEGNKDNLFSKISISNFSQIKSKGGVQES